MTDSILYWNQVALEANQRQPFQRRGRANRSAAERAGAGHRPPGDVRRVRRCRPGLGWTLSTDPHYLPAAELPTAKPGASPDAAIAGAAHHALSELFPKQKANFVDTLSGFIKDVTVPVSLTVDNLKDGYDYGEKVAMALLKRRKNDPGASPVGYLPKNASGKWRPDPDNPGQTGHAPHYGALCTLFATKKRYTNAPPPAVTTADGEYRRALRQVRSKGIEPSRLDSVADLYDQYTVVAGDTLGAIAQQFYGDASLFPRIFEANRHLISNPNVISVGQVLRIPDEPHARRNRGRHLLGLRWQTSGWARHRGSTTRSCARSPRARTIRWPRTRASSP